MITLVTGPPGSGKTFTLAARAAAQQGIAGEVLYICSHESGVRAAERELARHAPLRVAVDTAAGHMARLMRTNYALAGVSACLRQGGEAASHAIVREAAKGLLDLSWPMLRSGAIDLDLPFLSRPDAFLEEAAGLFRQLRRSRIGPDEFERGCRDGLEAFYGGAVERAIVWIHEPQLGARASRRGREALAVKADTLAAQRRAERDLGRLLVQLYREYLAAARPAPLQSDEDIVDGAVSWLERDERTTRALARSLSVVLVDDAEDAEPAVWRFLELLSAQGLSNATIAGWEEAAIDGINGRRSLLGLAQEPFERVTLTPRSVPAPAVKRFEKEKEEVDALAGMVLELIREGAKPHEIAVLTRSGDGASIYANALAERGVPAAQPRDRFGAPHDVLDWLALAAAVREPLDHAHLLRVLSSPLVGLSDASLFALSDDPESVTQLALDVGAEELHQRADDHRQRTALARNVLEGGADHRLPESTRSTVRRFRKQFITWRAATAEMGSAEMLAYLATAAGFERRWREAPAFLVERLLDDEQRLIAALVEEQACSQTPFSAIVSSFEDGDLAMRPAQRFEGLVACEEITGFKGEHVPHAFVAGVAHERFPRVYVSRAMAFTKNYGLIVRENVAPGPAQAAKFAWYYAKFEAKSRYLNEERRALRYALSRGSVSATAMGFGKPPRWAADQDLLSELEETRR